jgi:hypothetical protein
LGPKSARSAAPLARGSVVVLVLADEFVRSADPRGDSADTADIALFRS